MDLSDLALSTGAARDHDHLVEFYETDAFLAATVCSFLGAALRDGDAAIVVATDRHRQMFDTALCGAGIDVDAAVHEGRYLAFDATGLLTRFMVGGQPDPGRFAATIGAVMDLAGDGGRRVRVFGEMVAVLLDDGQVASALALEDLWNDLGRARGFGLLCAYPMRAFDDPDTTSAFQRICEQHTRVIPSEGYSLLGDPTTRLRAVARLQQQTAALRSEVVRLQGHHERPEAGVGPGASAGVQRDEAGVQRDEAGLQRDEAGSVRDHAGVARDQAADRRDQAADQRDEAADQRDQAAERSESTEEAGIVHGSFDGSARARREAASDRRRASQDRRAGARERVQAEHDRGTALADRGAGASERTEAELDRDTALADRHASARDREHLSHDALTHTYLRGAGFAQLEREMALVRQAGEPLAVVFIDVDHLKAVNDSHGHAAGDRMLLEVANILRAKLRARDLIIRYGGDEFVCAIAGLTALEARKRLELVNAALAEAPEHGSVTVGVAELRPGDSSEDVVARADASLYRQRRQQRSARPYRSPLAFAVPRHG